MPVDYGPLGAKPTKDRGADLRVLPMGHIRAFMVGARSLACLACLLV